MLVVNFKIHAHINKTYISKIEKDQYFYKCLKRIDKWSNSNLINMHDNTGCGLLINIIPVHHMFPIKDIYTNTNKTFDSNIFLMINMSTSHANEFEFEF